MSDEKMQPQDQRKSDGTPGKGQAETKAVEEIGGPEGPEPTRFGDWEKAGRCSDF